MITCTRRLQFCAGHRVLRHEGKCAEPHGHNYIVHITAQALGLDEVGRVIDFSVLKEKVGGWIDAQWDHGFLYSVEDQGMRYGLAMMGAKKTFALPTNPTAENLADYLLRGVCPMVLRDTGVTVVRVVVEETENCLATAELTARVRADEEGEA